MLHTKTASSVSSFNGGRVRVLHQWILHSHSGHRTTNAAHGANVRAHLGPHVHEPRRSRSPRQVWDAEGSQARLASTTIEGQVTMVDQVQHPSVVHKVAVQSVASNISVLEQLKTFADDRMMNLPLR
ncbi:hypothetical protein EV1_045369 [Malus domestica]